MIIDWNRIWKEYYEPCIRFRVRLGEDHDMVTLRYLAMMHSTKVWWDDPKNRTHKEDSAGDRTIPHAAVRA